MRKKISIEEGVSIPEKVRPRQARSFAQMRPSAATKAAQERAIAAQPKTSNLVSDIRRWGNGREK